MEGTEAVSTDHTNGSPLEDAAEQAHRLPDSLGSNEGSLNAPEVPVEDATGAPISAEAANPSHAEVPSGPSLDSGGYAKRSMEGVSSIQKLVHAMEAPESGYVDEIVGGEPEEQESLEFRVTCPGSPVRRLRLTGSRYTFGSAEGCSIRLSDETLRPMHAVLLRDASRILVRAYSVPVQVNGTRMTEATLIVGDVLRLGQYQFELLSVKRVGLGATHSQLEPNAPDGFDHPGTAAPDSRAGRFTTPSSEGSGSEDLLWRDRLRREVDQWRERQLECDRRESRIDERESEMRNRESELWSRAENLYRRESRLQSQESANFQLYDEFSQRQQEMLSLREDARIREETLHIREREIRDQELQYRSQLEEATQRLHQSQQQAEAATQSVARMREQFESLNAQIEQLSHQHLEIEIREKNQREEHESLRATLEEARDRAVEGHAESETRRREAEERVAELEGQILHLKATHGTSESEQFIRLSESEATAERLRQQVEDLQCMVSEARAEAEVLRADYEQACSSVQQLESIVSESRGRDDDDRQAWIAETGELRSAVEKLSADMERANHELHQLREANQDLTRRLTEVQQERDEARQDAETRPSSEEFQTLCDQLNSANEQLGAMKLEYEQTLIRLSVEQQHPGQPLAEPRPDGKADTTPEDTVWGEVGNEGLDESTTGADPGTLDQRHDDIPAVEGDVFQQSDGQHESVGDSRTLESEGNEGLGPVLGVESVGDLTNKPDDDFNTTNDPLQQGDACNSVSLEDEMRVAGQLPDGGQLIDGSLASKLIQDFESEQDLALKRPTNIEGYSSDLAHFDYDTESSEGPSYTGYTQPETEEQSYQDGSAFDGDADSAGVEPDAGTHPWDEPDAGEVDVDDPRDADPETGETQQIHDQEAEVSEDVGEDAGDDAQPGGVDDHEDTIEAYMNRLLQHVRGDAGENEEEVNATPAPDQDEDVADLSNEDLEPLDPNLPLIPRSQAPERDTDLSAMRELANESARIAINRSARIQTRSTQLKGVVSLGCSVGAVMCGVACYVFLPGMTRFLAAGMTGIVAIVYIREAMQLFQEANYQYHAATNTLVGDDETGGSGVTEEFADE